ncbi:MAG: PIN domain-containing protein [Polaromonas sp.]
MNCTLDANALVSWANNGTDERILARLDHLLETVSKAGGVIILPTPAISELLVRTAEGTAAWLTALQRRSSVRVASFDLRAATECALIHRLAVAAGGKRKGTKSGEHFQKIKVDRQIAAIARVAGADVLITDDENLISVCAFIGLPTKKLNALELPASASQTKLEFVAPSAGTDLAAE